MIDPQLLRKDIAAVQARLATRKFPVSYTHLTLPTTSRV